MAYRIGIANGYLDLLLMLKRFVESSMQIDNIVYDGGNTGDGYISAEGADDAAPEETWTIDFTSATAFTVTGSVSGLQTATGTVGTEYSSDSDEVTFTVIAGTTAWTSGDAITFDVITGLDTQKWTVDEYDDSDVDGSPEKQLIMHGPGTSGTDEIYVGIQTYKNAPSSIYGWKLAGFTGYNAAATFANQPGLHTGFPQCLGEDREMPYWIVANGRRILMCYEANTVYEWIHLGFMLPYGLPNENPYPLLIGGSTSLSNIAITSQEQRHSAFWNFCTTNHWTTDTSGKIWDGSWQQIINRYSSNDLDNAGDYDIFRFWPYCTGHYVSDGATDYEQEFFKKLRRNYDNSYPILPLILFKQRTTKRTIGQVQGLYAIPGDNTNPGDKFTIGGVDYYVFPNTYLRTNKHWAALKME